MGAAIRLMTSDPAPVLHMIGSRPSGEGDEADRHRFLRVGDVAAD
jgi:hypothetical protein